MHKSPTQSLAVRHSRMIQARVEEERQERHADDKKKTSQQSKNISKELTQNKATIGTA